MFDLDGTNAGLKVSNASPQSKSGRQSLTHVSDNAMSSLLWFRDLGVYLCKSMSPDGADEAPVGIFASRSLSHCSMYSALSVTTLGGSGGAISYGNSRGIGFTYEKCASGDKSLARRWMLGVLESTSEKNDAGSVVRGSGVRLWVSRCEEGGKGSFESGTLTFLDMAAVLLKAFLEALM